MENVPVFRRYEIVASSTGKKPMVAPYSGDMFDKVDRSSMERFSKPVGKFVSLKQI